MEPSTKNMEVSQKSGYPANQALDILRVTTERKEKYLALWH
jgi:hypothetical protein